jgi:hypothetical protein
MYLVQLQTGGTVQGLYSTLAAAQQAVANHAAAMAQMANTPNANPLMEWAQIGNVSGQWAWVPVGTNLATAHPWFVNNTPCGLLTDVSITFLQPNQPLPFV